MGVVASEFELLIFTALQNRASRWSCPGRKPNASAYKIEDNYKRPAFVQVCVCVLLSHVFCVISGLCLFLVLMLLVVPGLLVVVFGVGGCGWRWCLVLVLVFGVGIRCWCWCFVILSRWAWVYVWLLVCSVTVRF